MEGWPEGVGRRILETVDSTNAEAARMAPTLSGPCWIMARQQSAGRGRRGRAWAHPPGNFAATLVLRPAEAPAEAALRSFVAALALREALIAVSGCDAAVTLKWPNDVLLNGAKVAGILLESAGRGGALSYLAIGFGVNLSHVPARADLEVGATRPVSLAAETGARLTPEAFLDALAPAYARWERQFVTYGFAPIRAAWLAQAARLGQEITARTATARLTGRFETVDESGALVLDCAGERVIIPAADVFF